VTGLYEVRFRSLPLDQAVKIQRGSGKRVLAIFSDAYCPACKQLEGALQQVDDITIYVFMYPVIRPDLSEHSKAVWCSADRGAAWLDLVLRGKRPAARAACQDPVEKNLLLGRTLRVNATPTLIFANGERHSGGLPIPQLEQRLNHRRQRRRRLPRRGRRKWRELRIRALGPLDDLDLVVDRCYAGDLGGDLTGAVALAGGGSGAPETDAPVFRGHVDRPGRDLAVAVERLFHALCELLVRVGLRRLGRLGFGSLGLGSRRLRRGRGGLGGGLGRGR
jgi:thioredoxin-related protein